MVGNGQPPEHSSTGNFPPPVNGSNVLFKLLNQVNVPTLVAILAMNGWNIGATNSASQEHIIQVKTALHEIHDLHEAIDDFERRQKMNVDGVTAILNGQGKQLQNQTDLLKKQDQILIELHAWQQNFRKPE